MNTQMNTTGGDPQPLRVAIVGAGPSGCYTAQALKKARPNAEISIIDGLPTPYGLVRYGIAPDHQGAKAVARQFDRLFAQPNVHFAGNVLVGKDVSLEELQRDFHVVVLATGLAGDRKLGVYRDPDAAVVGAGELIKLLNSYPDSDLRTNPLRQTGSEVVILGTGNVAVDTARLLAKSDLDLIASDINDDALRSLFPAPVARIHILGRCKAADAKWDPSMVKELAEVVGVNLYVDGTPLLESLSPSPRTVIDIWFERTPVSIRKHAGRVSVVTRRCSDDDGTATLEADLVVTALGFEASREELSTPAEALNLYRVGGPATGRLGNLAENRKFAGEVTKSILAELASKPLSQRPGIEGLRARLPHTAVTFDGWKRIDAAEVDRARPDRCRTKFTTRAELLATANADGARSFHTLTATAATSTQEN